ncbi:inositol monophosphatase family protein [Nocardia sp. NPDC046473]|uniref:inositol monophosphatase family protein n=1 Tax=Nocardia sp. NPDC046473 TaxID=3155733 RepID=UPI0033CD68F7
MTNPSAIPELARHLATIVRQAMDEIRPRLIQAALTGDRGESENLRHRDNFLSDYDLWMHQRYKQLLRPHLPSFVYASEEADPEVIGDEPDPELCVLVDPLDTSELAVRGLYGYTHVLVYSRRQARPIAAAVGDIFHHFQLYLAAQDHTGTDRAFLITRDGHEHLLDRPSQARLSEALVTNYLMRPEQRFKPLTNQQPFLAALATESADGRARGRIGVDFGSVGLCHVAAGFTDAMIEFAKGFAIWDLSPGHFILHAAGGIVTDLQGTPLTLNYDLTSMTNIREAMGHRRRFIAAGNTHLAKEIQRSLRH